MEFLSQVAISTVIPWLELDGPETVSYGVFGPGRDFNSKIFSRLRRGDLRYTTILFENFSQTSLDDGFQKNLGASEPNEENRPEVKTPNPARRRFKE